MEGGWHICALGVMSVVTKVGGHVTDGHGGGNTLERHFNDLKDHLENANGIAASPPIGAALSEFIHHYTPALTGMATKTGNCIKGSVHATKYYILADHEMGAEAKRHLKMAAAAEKKAIEAS